MTIFKKARKPASRWQLVLAVIPTLLIGACAGESQEPEDSAQTTVGDKAGCTHIQFCSTPNTNHAITCITNDQSCTRNARYNECISDANFVCGRDRPIIFNPPIPCPVTASDGSIICRAGDEPLTQFN